jgi:hypothetical protein
MPIYMYLQAWFTRILYNRNHDYLYSQAGFNQGSTIYCSNHGFLYLQAWFTGILYIIGTIAIYTRELSSTKYCRNYGYLYVYCTGMVHKNTVPYCTRFLMTSCFFYMFSRILHNMTYVEGNVSDSAA